MERVRALAEQPQQRYTDDTAQWQPALDTLDLDLFVPPHEPWWQRVLYGPGAQRRVARSTRSLLIMQNGRWPLRRILLILRAEPSDWSTMPWIERLAQPDKTSLTLLPVVPPWPRLQRRLTAAQPSPAVLLARNTASGAMIRQFTTACHQRRIATTLALATGDPDTRIRATVATQAPDLILIAAEPHSRLLRLCYGELVKPLLWWVKAPLLIAK